MCTTHNVKTHETTVYFFTTVISQTSELYRLFETEFAITSHVVEEFKNGTFINICTAICCRHVNWHLVSPIYN